MSDLTLNAIVQSLVKGITSQVEGHADLLAQLENRNVDEFNQLFDDHEELQREHDRNVELARSVVRERDALIAQRREDEKDVKKIVEMTKKVTDERNAYLTELKELRPLNAKKLKEQVNRLKESNKAKDTAVKQAKQEQQKAERVAIKVDEKYHQLVERHNTLVDCSKEMLRVIRFEGGYCEKETDGFSVFRKPISPREIYKSTSGESDIADTPFYFRVETLTGIHFDIFKLTDGELGYPQHGLTIPQDIIDHVAKEFADADNWSQEMFAVGATTVDQSELDALINSVESRF